MTFGRWTYTRYERRLSQPTKASARIGHMDPLGTLIVTLGTLLILDIAALQLGGARRPRSRARGPRR